MTVTKRDRLIEQLRERGIRDEAVLGAMRAVPRDRFVPESHRKRAWDDDALPLSHGQSISQPYVVALMTESLKLAGGERVLEIGTGSGYQAAVLRAVGAQVVSVERIEELSRAAGRLLDELGIDGVELCIGDGSLGWAAGAPYDAVLVTAGAPRVPEALWQQLKPGGRITVPVGDRSVQTLKVFERDQDDRRETKLCDCRFVQLVGQDGW